MEHTKGPWNSSNFSKRRITAGDMIVCDICGWGYLTGIGGLNLPPEKAVEIQDANAALIEAAPDLLDVARRIVERMNDNGYQSDDQSFGARAAIAKAEGRAA